MKTAVSMFSFAQDADLREKFALIRRAGYDGYALLPGRAICLKKTVLTNMGKLN